MRGRKSSCEIGLRAGVRTLIWNGMKWDLAITNSLVVLFT